MLMKIAQSFAPDAIVVISLVIFLLTSSDVGTMIYALSATAAAESFMSILRAYIISEITEDN